MKLSHRASDFSTFPLISNIIYIPSLRVKSSEYSSEKIISLYCSFVPSQLCPAPFPKLSLLQASSCPFPSQSYHFCKLSPPALPPSFPKLSLLRASSCPAPFPKLSLLRASSQSYDFCKLAPPAPPPSLLQASSPCPTPFPKLSLLQLAPPVLPPSQILQASSPCPVPFPTSAS